METKRTSPWALLMITVVRKFIFLQEAGKGPPRQSLGMNPKNSRGAGIEDTKAVVQESHTPTAAMSSWRDLNDDDEGPTCQEIEVYKRRLMRKRDDPSYHTRVEEWLNNKRIVTKGDNATCFICMRYVPRTAAARPTHPTHPTQVGEALPSLPRCGAHSIVVADEKCSTSRGEEEVSFHYVPCWCIIE